MKLNDPNAWGAVAENGKDHQVAGSIFLNMFPQCQVAVIGPLTVSPSAEGGVGRELMLAALEEANDAVLSEFGSCNLPVTSARWRSIPSSGLT